jgi:predicted nucleic acid-binding protein
MTRIIVCDTGPLLHLSEAGAVHLLSLAGKILIPPLVVTEFEANAQGWSPPQWVQIIALENSGRRKAESLTSCSVSFTEQVFLLGNSG